MPSSLLPAYRNPLIAGSCLQNTGGTDPLAGIAFALRIQLGLYQDVLCTIPSDQVGDPIAGVKDEFGSLGIMATQADSGARLTMQLDNNGQPSMSANGINNCLMGTLPSFKGALIWRAMADPANVGAVYSQAGSCHEPYSDGLVYETFNATARVESVDVSNALYNWAVYRVQNVAGTHKIFVNGVEKSSVARTTQTMTNFAIGSSYPNGILFFYKGLISNVYVCDPADAPAVENYLLTL